MAKHLYQVGHPQYGHILKGQKTAKTIAKEKAREVFEQKHLRIWDLIAEAQASDAVRDSKARQYSIDQVIGRSTDTIKHEGLEFLFDKDEK